MEDMQTTAGLDDARALKLGKDAYTGSTSYFDSSVRNEIEADIRRFQSKFPNGSKYLSDAYKARSRIYRPKTRATIRKNEAVLAEALFSTLDLVAVTPTDPTNPVHAASADVMGQLLQYRLTKSIPWFLTCLGAYQDAQVTGVVVSHQHWEYNKAKGIDRPAIELLPVENIRFDPAASWVDPINTSPYLVHLMPMYLKDVRARMRSGRWRQYEDGQILTAMRQYDTTRQQREGNRQDSTQTAVMSDFAVVWVHKVIVEVDDTDYLFYSLGTELLLTSPVPLTSEYAHGKRPYVLGYCVVETHKVYPSGVSRLGAQIQDEINEVTNQRLDNVKFVLNKRYFVRRNKQVDIRSLTRNVPGAVTLLTDPEQDVKIVETGDVTSSSYNEQDRLNLDYDDVAGVFSGSSVASNRKLNETVGGMNILTSNANQITGYQLRTFTETWTEPVLRQLMLLEQHYETDEVVLALAGQKAQIAERFGMDAVTDELLAQELSLTVNVGMGATSPTDKINGLALGMGTIRTVLADGLLEKYGLRPEELIKEVLGALGHRDGGRFFDFEQGDDPRVQALMQQVQQLQQALAAKNPPELIAAQVAKLQEEAKKVATDRWKSGVEGFYAAMEGGQVVAQLPTVAPIADKIAQAAGYEAPIPAGIDPNIPAPAQAMQGGVDFPQNTHPVTPASPFVGARQGIETQRNDGVQQFSQGGLVRGPGTGKSDSIPAVIDGHRPAALSSGEFVMPEEAVRYYGPAMLDRMVQQARLEGYANGGLIPVDIMGGLNNAVVQPIIEDFRQGNRVLQEKYPVPYQAAQMHPAIGIPTAAMNYADAMQAGNREQAIGAALSAIPVGERTYQVGNALAETARSILGHGLSWQSVVNMGRKTAAGEQAAETLEAGIAQGGILADKQKENR